jgi:hypothetical protein
MIYKAVALTPKVNDLLGEVVAMRIEKDGVSYSRKAIAAEAIIALHKKESGLKG